MEETMKLKFASALFVALATMTLADRAYALDCKATNLTKAEQGICALRAVTTANAKTAPGTATITNRCAGQVGQALTDCKRAALASCIPLPAGAEKTACNKLYGG